MRQGTTEKNSEKGGHLCFWDTRARREQLVLNWFLEVNVLLFTSYCSPPRSFTSHAIAGSTRPRRRSIDSLLRPPHRDYRTCVRASSSSFDYLLSLTAARSHVSDCRPASGGVVVSIL